jgi:site-specific DNA-methyltransferase (adenine-specific)
MNELDQLAISRILGSTVRPISRPAFGGFSAVSTIGQMLANRPIKTVPLAPDKSRDSIIVKAFAEIHNGYSVDRSLADPQLAARYVSRCRQLGIDATHAAICRRLLRLRKAGGFPVRTTREDERDLHPFLIPAELAFAKLTYRYDASYDDLLADPDVGRFFDENVVKVGRSGDVVAYRLAALHLRKNVRSRRRADAKQLAALDISKVRPSWHTPGHLTDVRPNALPESEGVFSLREPDRYLFLSKSDNLRSAIGIFQDANVLASVGNHFWSPSPDKITVGFVKPEDVRGVSLRLFEFKAIETYQPIFNMLPKAA